MVLTNEFMADLDAENAPNGFGLDRLGGSEDSRDIMEVTLNDLDSFALERQCRAAGRVSGERQDSEIVFGCKQGFDHGTPFWLG